MCLSDLQSRRANLNPDDALCWAQENRALEASSPPACVEHTFTLRLTTVKALERVRTCSRERPIDAPPADGPRQVNDGKSDQVIEVCPPPH